MIVMKTTFLRPLTAAFITVTLLCGALTPAVSAAETDGIPSSYSSADLGYTTSVKNQQYTDCWAYASLATFESKLLRSGYQISDMSANHLNMWATTRADESGWIRNYSQEGYSKIATGYLTSWQGGVQVTDLPDYPLSNDVTGDQVPDNLARFGVTAIETLTKDDTDAIKRAIMDHGGVYACYANSHQFFSDDKTCYYMPESYTGGYQGHAIEVVGWNDNYPRRNFNENNRPEKKGAWLIKNSWGDNNSLHGYFWMSYEDKYLFAPRFKPVYAITEVMEIDDTVKLSQNEVFGATYDFGYTGSTRETFINRLQFDEDFQKIDKIVFMTACKGASYDIYYVPDKDGAPSADTADWTKLYSGTADYSGYICTDIEDFDLTDTTGSIAVTIDNTASGGTASIGVSEWLSNAQDKYVFLDKCSRGESYLLRDGNMTDVLDYYHDEIEDDIGGTFVIKAITRRTSRWGDANLDGEVNIADATEIQKALAQMVTFNDEAIRNADVNRDGEINITDATVLQRHLAGI